MLGLAAVLVAAGLGVYLWPRSKAHQSTAVESSQAKNLLAPAHVFKYDEDAPVDQLLFYPDGSRVVSVTGVSRITAWDLASGQPVTSARDNPAEEGAEFFYKRRRQRIVSQALFGHLLAASPANPLSLVPLLCLKPADVADAHLQGQRQLAQALRLFGLTFAQRPLPQLVFSPAMAQTDPTFLQAAPLGFIGFTWGSFTAPPALCIAKGPEGLMLLECVSTEYRAPATADDGDSPYLAIRKDGKKELVMNRVKIKGHTLGKEAEGKTGFTTLDLDGPLFLALGYSSDGQRLLLADRNHQLLQVEIQVRAQDKETVVDADLVPLSFKNPNEQVQPLLLLPDGKQALMADEAQSVGVWDLDTSKEVKSLEGLLLPLNGLAVSADGKRVLAWSGNKNVALWDTATGQESQRLSILQGKVRLVVLSANGRRALIDTEDGTLQVWDVETGKVLRELQYPEKPPTAITLSADGRQAAVATGDAIQVWDLGS